jgi:hypothetical protein
MADVVRRWGQRNVLAAPFTLREKCDLSKKGGQKFLSAAIEVVHVAELPPSVQPAMIGRMVALRELRLGEKGKAARWLTDALVRDMFGPQFTAAATLRSISVDGSQTLTDEAIRIIAGAATNLTTFSAARLPLLTDAAIAALASLPLEEVALTSCARLTDTALAWLASLSSLTQLSLENCVNQFTLSGFVPFFRLTKLRTVKFNWQAVRGGIAGRKNFTSPKQQNVWPPPGLVAFADETFPDRRRNRDETTEPQGGFAPPAVLAARRTQRVSEDGSVS